MLNGQTAVVLGLARSGVATVRYLAAEGVPVIAMDDQSTVQIETLAAALRGLPVTFWCGRAELPPLTTVGVIVASPGIAPTHPLLRAAAQVGIPVVNEMELAIRACKTPVIAITGTNGKSTTTTLVGALLQAAGERVVVGGNLGTPVLDLLPALQHARYGVLEVSSYQIDTAPNLQPQIAVMLNVTPDHLDRYGTFEAYVAAKQALLTRLPAEAMVIYNANDPVVVTMMCAVKARALPFCVTAGTAAAATASWGERPGAYAIDGMVQVVFPDGRAERWDLRHAQLSGVHNQENMVAAGLVAALVGVPSQTICSVLTTFTGLPHRCQLVGEWRGVRYYDDSKGTNVGAVVKSLEGFSAPVVLLAGGQDKGTGYAELREIVGSRVKHLVAFGEARELIAEELQDVVPLTQVDNMEHAVRRAIEVSGSGDVVLLSPACASFDQYPNYAVRGDDFARWVRQLHDGHLGAAVGGGAW